MCSSSSTYPPPNIMGEKKRRKTREEIECMFGKVLEKRFGFCVLKRVFEYVKN